MHPGLDAVAGHFGRDGAVADWHRDLVVPACHVRPAGAAVGCGDRAAVDDDNFGNAYHCRYKYRC